jgi:hypothetical protein
MTTRDYLDAAIRAADGRGTFDLSVVSRQFKMTKPQGRAMGAQLESLKLATAAGKGRWRLVGVAGELAVALHGRHVK